MFDLLKSFALSFRNTQKYRDKAGEANTGVGPKRPCGSEAAIQNGKGEGQNKGSTPARWGLTLFLSLNLICDGSMTFSNWTADAVGTTVFTDFWLGAPRRG